MLNDDLGVEGTRSASRALEEAGFGSIWVGETFGFDVVTQTSLVACSTSEAQVGLVWNIFTRPPALAAMTLASLASLTGGRLSVALGASSQFVVERWNGIPFERPVERMVALVHALRSCFSGDRLEGGFRLKVVPEVPPELVVATTGPQMLAAVSSLVDGVMVNWCTPHDLPRIPGLPADPARLRAVMYVAPTDDDDAARSSGRALIASYLNVPAYAAIQRLTPRATRLEACWDLWSKGDRRGAAAAVPDDVVDELVVHGSPAQCRARVTEWQAVGVRPLVNVVGPPEHRFRLAALGPNASNDTWEA
jgi:probable F420-dependent oxidoreductase